MVTLTERCISNGVYTPSEEKENGFTEKKAF
jgi:hypothetical protein